MRVKPIVFLFSIAALISVLIVTSGLLYHQVIRHADYEADRFGFPYYWIEHVTTTFAGQTDYWYIIAWNFAFDFLIFLAVSHMTLGLVWKSRKS